MHSPEANSENLDQRITEEIWAAPADGKVAWRRLSEGEARELNRLADHTGREQHTRHSLGDPGFENAAFGECRFAVGLRGLECRKKCQCRWRH